MPTMTRRAPAAIAARSSSPVPRVVVIKRVAFLGGHEHQPRGRRHLDARRSDRHPAGRSGRRPAPRAGRSLGLRGYEPPVAATRAWVVPSPPSAIGTWSIDASGDARTTPRAIAAAASRAVKLPLNLSGAITTRIVAGPAQARRPLTPRLGLQGVSSVDQASQCKHTRSTQLGPTRARRPSRDAEHSSSIKPRRL